MMYIKNNIKLIIAFILGILVSIGTVFATTQFNSKNITYDNNNTSINSNNVQDAIDELYNKADNSYNNGFSDGVKYGLGTSPGIEIASSVSTFNEEYTLPGVTLTLNDFKLSTASSNKADCSWTDSWGYSHTCSAPALPTPSLTYTNGVLKLSGTSNENKCSNGNDGSGCKAKSTVKVNIYCTYFNN